MRFIGDSDGDLGYHGLYAILVSLQLPPFLPGSKILGAIRFIIDTGSSHTIISIPDAIRVGIDHNKLEPSMIPVHGIGGSADVLALKKCRLYFTDHDTGRPYPEDLESVLVISPFVDDVEKRQTVWSIPSLLGIDVLKKYHISFTSMSVYLDL